MMRWRATTNTTASHERSQPHRDARGASLG
jgi:hypothetical protein